MVDQKSLKRFDKLYDETYKDISRYVVCNCSNIDDVKDILQNIYMEVYKKIDVIEDKKYIIGIAKNKIYKYYRFNYKQKIINFFRSDDETYENIPSNYNLEKSCFLKFDTDMVWDYLKKKPVVISKIVYLYYYEGINLKEISECLNIPLSNVKNYLYRTLKELKLKVGD